MSGDDQRKELRRRKIDGADYDVGYGKPPKQSQFQAGQSGNPRGRPKGAKNHAPVLGEERLKGIILTEAYREIAVRDGDQNVTVPMAQAIVRAIAVSAAKGNARAQKVITDLVLNTEADNKRSRDEFLQVVMSYKFDWEREISYRKLHGLAVPEPLPHPDHIEINLRSGAIRIVGPLTKKGKENWDWLQARKADFEDEKAETQAMIKDRKNADIKTSLQDDIVRTDRFIEIVDRAIRSYTGEA